MSLNQFVEGKSYSSNDCSGGYARNRLELPMKTSIENADMTEINDEELTDVLAVVVSQMTSFLMLPMHLW